jgi:flagella basal body P-ring formation protein FlgA
VATQHQASILAAASAQALRAARAAGYPDAKVLPDRIPLDPAPAAGPRARSHLPVCDRPLTADSPAGARPFGQTTVAVRCDGARGWTLYVPVRVEAQAPALRLVRDLPRGAVLAPQDLAPGQAPAGGGSHVTDPALAIGKQLTRGLAAGSLLRGHHLTEQRLVQRGQTVLLRSGLRGLQVQMQGRVLSDGTRGQRVRVENTHSGRIVEGIVEADGSVAVTALAAAP